MSSISLLLGEAQFRTAIAQLKLDAATNVQHAASATPTKNPVEARSGDPIDNFTDHIRLNNRVVQIDGLISESPLSVLGSAFNVFTGAAGGLVGDIVGGQLGGFTQQALAAGLGSLGGLIANRNQDGLQFPQKAFDYLQELRDLRIPFTLVTRLRKYDSMVLTNLSVPQVAKDGKSLRFSATFEQIEIVQTRTVIIPTTSVTNPSAASTQNLGKQAQKTASEATGSLAKQLTDNLGLTVRGSGV